MALFGGRKQEQFATWRLEAQGELARLQALTAPQLGAEVMSRGFAETAAPGDRRHLDRRFDATESTLATMLCPDPPGLPQGDDLSLLEQFRPFADDSLQALEHASLIQSKQGSTSDGLFYTATRSGLTALESGEVESILAKQAQG